MTERHKEPFVSFYSTNKHGRRLVGVGLTDAMIEQLKKSGAAMSQAERNGSDTDVVVFYAPELNELVQKIKQINPGAVNVKML